MFTRICPPIAFKLLPCDAWLSVVVLHLSPQFWLLQGCRLECRPTVLFRTAVGASDQAVIGRMIWDDEFIAAALGASEGGVRHGACRSFWLAFANLVSLGRTIMRPAGRKSSPVLKPRGAWLLLVRWLRCRAGQGNLLVPAGTP